MRVRVKLMGGLRYRVPAAEGGLAEVEVEPGTTCTALLDALGIPSPQIHLLMVNGAMELDRSRSLSDGDQVTVFPPVAGGAFFV